ncbi:hypothetical protein [Paludisphaera sp.]|uniref:hypothetical protein n=1 Tax=Paludisphaera sp. TaxID=2017432 RepID=UPI00301B7E00
MNIAPFGFRADGKAAPRRFLADHGAALAGFAAARGIVPGREAFLSAWSYPPDLLAWHDAQPARDQSKGWSAGYRGPCGASWLPFDLDDESDPGAALAAAGRLADHLARRHDPGAVFVNFSGSKGAHVALATGDLIPPGPDVPALAKAFALAAAADAGVVIDTSIYHHIPLFRAPNSWHAKTTLYAVPIPLDDVVRGIDLAEAKRRAAAPIPFDLPTGPPGPRFAEDWAAARAAVEAAAARPAPHSPLTEWGVATLNRATWTLLQTPERVGCGDRHRLLYSSARDMAEKSADVDDLVLSLLMPIGCAFGFDPADVRRQVECGIEDARPPRRTP